MKGDKQVIQQLNAVLTLELTAINQYFLHSRMQRNWGFDELNEHSYKKSIQDMKQADDLIERILFLEGLPNLQDLGRLRIGENIPEMLECDMSLQLAELTTLRSTIALCESQQDYVSRELLEKILDEEEEQVDWIETQQHLIQTTGIENYLQSQMS
ncbi:bacterioferritin [Motiliproteus sediminis]|uniref:bacterioferritin n=1 Tax=Motiliproteus sediminis TaxID=1468178 RepID=UPI001AEFB27D|nr:bacterioferritin [Motiliproteus sediminis]